MNAVTRMGCFVVVAGLVFAGAYGLGRVMSPAGAVPTVDHEPVEGYAQRGTPEGRWLPWLAPTPADGDTVRTLRGQRRTTPWRAPPHDGGSPLPAGPGGVNPPDPDERGAGGARTPSQPPGDDPATPDGGLRRLIDDPRHGVVRTLRRTVQAVTQPD